MKFKHVIISFLCITLFFCCKTPPVQKVLLNEQFYYVGEGQNKELKIYFPQFYDSDGNAYGGDGTVIILPDNKILVIDGFVAAAATQYIDFIKSLNISKIDYLFATHYHGDHIGSFPQLIDNFEVGVFYSNGAPIQNAATPLLEEKIEEYGIKHIVLTQGDTLTFLEDCTAEVLWPNLSEKDKYDVMFNPGRTEAKINLTSLVTKLTYNDFSILFPGDIYHKGERELVSRYGNKLKSTVLKAAHHGEWYTANLPEFVRMVSPDYGIIQDNRYITFVISNIYKKAGSKILYRLTPGYILIETDGSDYKISEQSFNIAQN